MNQFLKFMRRPTFRYLVVGVAVYVVELIVIIVAQQFGATPVWAVTWSFGVGLVFSFLLQKLFTFRDRRMQHKIIISQAVAVILLILFNLGFTLVVIKLLENMLPPVVTRTIALLVTTIWNFYLYKTRIFNNCDKNEPIPID